MLSGIALAGDAAPTEKKDLSQMSAVDDNGNLSIGKCIAKGNTDFGSFIRSLIALDGFWYGISEPWKDVLMRNQCHVTDLSNLVKQQDAIQKYIRDAFLTCKAEKIPSLKRALTDVTAEIYYVRNVVNPAFGLGLLPANIKASKLKDEKDKEKAGVVFTSELFLDKGKLYSDMKKKYGDKNKYFFIEDFDDKFSWFEQKYADRKDSYVVCERGGWKDVADKWNEFRDTILYGGAFKDFAKDVKTAAKRSKERRDQILDTSASKSFWASTAEQFQMNINGLSAGDGWDEISAEWDKYSPGKKDKPKEEPSEGNTDSTDTSNEKAVATQSEFLHAYTKSVVTMDFMKHYGEMEVHFRTNYGLVSDSAIGGILAEMDALNKEILDSLTPLDKIDQCTAKMNNRQCPNKK